MVRRNSSIRLLILNEDTFDTVRIQEELGKVDLAFDIQIARRQSEFIKKALKMAPDVVIASHELSKYTALEAYEDLRRAHPFTAFILISEEFTREEMAGYMLSGIDAFIQPNDYSFLPIAIVQGINKKRTEKSYYEAQVATTESKKRLRSVFYNDQNAIFIVGFKCEIIDLNPSAVSVLEKLNLEAMKGKDLTSYIDKGDLKKFKAAHASAFRGKSSTDEFTFSLSKKTNKQASINFVPIKNEEGFVTSVIIICKDISEAFFFRQKFKISEERFLALASNAPVGIFYNNEEGRCLFVNKKWCEYTGLTFRQSIGDGWRKAIHPDDLEKMANLKTELRSGKPEVHLDYRIINTSGNVLWLRSTTARFTDENGKLLGYTGTLMDITNDKLYQKEILEVQDRYHSSVKLAALGEWNLTLLTQKAFWSEEMFKIYERDAKLGPPTFPEFLNYSHVDDRARLIKFQDEVLGTDETRIIEYRILTCSGKIKYVKGTVHAVRNIEGKVEKMEGVLLDITENVMGELKIHDAQKRQDTAMQLSGIALWERNLSNEVTEWTDNMYSIFEKEKSGSSPTNKEFINAYVHPEDRERMKTIFKNFVPGETLNEIYFSSSTPSGKTKHLRGTIYSENDIEGNPSMVLGFVQDVTAIKENEEKLKASEEKFRYLFNHSPDGIFIEDLEGKILEVNEVACNIQGMEKGDLIGKNIFQITPVELKNEISENFHKLADGDITSLKSFCWHKNGTKIPIQIKQSRIVFNGEPALLLHVRKTEEETILQTVNGIQDKVRNENL